MNTNEKGVKGLIKVIDDLQENGFYSFPAFDDHSPIDIIAVDKLGNSYKLQVKYRQRSPEHRKKSERYGIIAFTVVNGKKVPINRDLIDGWAVYLFERNKVVYIHKSLLDGKGMLTINPDTNYGKLSDWKSL